MPAGCRQIEYAMAEWIESKYPGVSATVAEMKDRAGIVVATLRRGSKRASAVVDISGTARDTLRPQWLEKIDSQIAALVGVLDGMEGTNESQRSSRFAV